MTSLLKVPSKLEDINLIHVSIVIPYRELSFQKGDFLQLLHTVDDNWLEASIDGNEGIIPRNYVKVRHTFVNHALPHLPMASFIVLHVKYAVLKVWVQGSTIRHAHQCIPCMLTINFCVHTCIACMFVYV